MCVWGGTEETDTMQLTLYPRPWSHTDRSSIFLNVLFLFWKSQCIFCELSSLMFAFGVEIKSSLSSSVAWREMEFGATMWLVRVLPRHPIRRILMVCRWLAATVMSMEAVWVIRRALCTSWVPTVSSISVTATKTTAPTGRHFGFR